MNSENQLRVLLLLLAAAVILPTVCLLWFMNQAVKNTQMAIRQQLENAYQQRLENITSIADTQWQGRLATLDSTAGWNPETVFYHFTTADGPAFADSMIIMDANWNVLYPIIGPQDLQDESDIVKHYFKVDLPSNCNQALMIYKGLHTVARDRCTVLLAFTGMARCYFQLGQYPEAQAAAHKAGAWDDGRYLRPECARLAAYARLFEFEHFILQSSDPNRSVFELSDYPPNDFRYLPMPLTTRIFCTQSILRLAEQTGQVSAHAREANDLRTVLRGLTLAQAILADEPNTIRPLRLWSFDVLRKFGNNYAILHRSGDRYFLLVFAPQDVSRLLHEVSLNLDGMFHDARWRLVNEQGLTAAGSDNAAGQPFIKRGFNSYMPGWQVEIFLKDASVFEWESRRQKAYYIWAGMLAIAFMTITAITGAGMVLRQVRINRLKNDFVATVSHELRTPLASMRLFLDTLLENRYSSPEQAKEYLELAAKENKRLTRLIDNFLSFSRMERGKLSFAFAPTPPAKIADDAVSAVKSKYQQQGCTLKVQADDSLPDIQADDSLVTAVVNLLDNACKYTREKDKQVCLRVYAEPGAVCFSVQDNGIGLSRRAQKKIFEKFYQVDQTLARKAEGCGLGLAIVKFIVEAHHGTIDVVSSLGKGSVFTIRIPLETGE